MQVAELMVAIVEEAVVGKEAEQNHHAVAEDEESVYAECLQAGVHNSFVHTSQMSTSNTIFDGSKVQSLVQTAAKPPVDQTLPHRGA